MYTAHYHGTAQVVVITGLVLLYCLPTLIAWINRRKNSAAITLLNLFLGWTFLGWVLPLVLACIPDGHVLQASLPAPQPLRFARPYGKEGREMNKTSREESNAQTKDAFVVPGRLILEEGPEAT